MARHWLMKSEPEVYSFDRLASEGETLWEGVRNYQARNFMMKDMAVGDWVLFYHSNAEPPCVAGLAKVSGPAEPDPTQFDRKSEYFDPKASRENPRWYCVKVAYAEKLPRPVPLAELRRQKSLQKMILLQPGTRLSITPVTATEFSAILKLAQLEANPESLQR